MVIRRHGAAGKDKLGHRQRHAEIERFRRQPRPDRVKRLQPGKQLAVERGGNGAGEGLIEVMVGVDQPRKHHVLAGIERFDLRRRGAASGGDQFDDAAALHHDAAVGSVRQDGDRILDPQC